MHSSLKVHVGLRCLINVISAKESDNLIKESRIAIATILNNIIAAFVRLTGETLVTIRHIYGMLLLLTFSQFWSSISVLSASIEDLIVNAQVSLRLIREQIVASRAALGEVTGHSDLRKRCG